MDRRDFLKITTAASAGSLLVAPTVDAEKRNLGIRRYRTLGRTGQKISDLSLGGGGLSSPKVVSRALQLGVTYIDTAPDYGRSERFIGRGWKMSGVARDKFHITTKICRPGGYPGHVNTRISEKQIIRYVEGSLKRLQTDYVDNLFVHAVGERGRHDIKRLSDPEMLMAVQKLKEQGKVKHLGCSTHGPYRPLESLLFAIETGYYDVIMPAYNLYKWKGLDMVLKYAKKHNVGVIAMKTLRGGKQARKKGVLPKGNFAHAAFKWVWSNEAVAGLIVTMQTIGKLERYMKASGGKLAYNEQHSLQKMAAATSDSVCRIGCGDCLDRCSQKVSIPNIFRYDMYLTEYGQEKHARGRYRELKAIGESAADCAGCTNQTCLGACTYGVPIRDGMLDAHNRLA